MRVVNDHLTIVGVHGRAHLEAADQSSEDKAILVIAGDNATIENFEFSGARVPVQKCAGIRHQGTNLLSALLLPRQPGRILATGPGRGRRDRLLGVRPQRRRRRLLAQHVHRPRPQLHAPVQLLDRARVGHLVKSRALRNYILYDRLTGEHGTDSYELDLPNGGLSYAIGTVIEQGTNTQNPNMLAYGEEGDLNPDSRLYAVNDTFVNDLHRGDWIFIGSQVTDPVFAENDISTGSTAFVSQPGASHAARLHHEPTGVRRPCSLRLHPEARLPRAGGRRRADPGPRTASRSPLDSSTSQTAGHTTRTDGGTIAGAFGS